MARGNDYEYIYSAVSKRSVVDYNEFLQKPLLTIRIKDGYPYKFAHNKDRVLLFDSSTYIRRYDVDASYTSEEARMRHKVKETPYSDVLFYYDNERPDILCDCGCVYTKTGALLMVALKNTPNNWILVYNDFYINSERFEKVMVNKTMKALGSWVLGNTLIGVMGLAMMSAIFDITYYG